MQNSVKSIFQEASSYENREHLPQDSGAGERRADDPDPGGLILSGPRRNRRARRRKRSAR